MGEGQRTVHLLITGHVQGVYFRAWTAAIAETLQLDGWVRNRRDGSVEALFQGAGNAIESMIGHCRNGPPDARVDRVEIIQEAGAAPAGFAVLPTA